jgi:hypothetical protein
MYFWRTSTGTEADFVVDTGAVLVPIEVKTSATPRPAMAAGIVAFRELLGAKAAYGYVVQAGEVRLRSPRASRPCHSRSSSQPLPSTCPGSTQSEIKRQRSAVRPQYRGAGFVGHREDRIRV